jgi:hypothetical protein
MKAQERPTSTLGFYGSLGSGALFKIITGDCHLREVTDELQKESHWGNKWILFPKRDLFVFLYRELLQAVKFHDKQTLITKSLILFYFHCRSQRSAFSLIEVCSGEGRRR